MTLYYVTYNHYIIVYYIRLDQFQRGAFYRLLAVAAFWAWSLLFPYYDCD